MAQLNVNTDALISLTHKLEKLNRSAFPVAVRQTLNDAAFDVKKRTLPKSASKNFQQRSPNFFKTFSAVNKAEGFNVNRMVAIVGMSDRGKGKAAETAVDNMEKQEKGGVIREGASYLEDARSGNNQKKVTRSNYFSNGRKLTGPSRKRSKKSQFVANAFASKKQNARFSIKTNSGRYLIQVMSIRKEKGGGLKIKSRVLMTDRKSKPSSIKATNFMSEAAQDTSKKIEAFYAKAAEKQFTKALR